MFLALEAALGSTHGPLIAYFDVCRQKRNDLNYDAANVVSDTEADELLRKAHEFRVFVDEWIVKHQPSLA